MRGSLDGKLVVLDGWRGAKLMLSRDGGVRDPGVVFSAGEVGLVLRQEEKDGLPDVLLLAPGGRRGWIHSEYLAVVRS